MTFVSYAQNFEDVLLWRALRSVPAGFYIDVGASFPDTDSVTRAFYDRGWRGINVEPTKEAFRRLAAARPRDVNLNLAIAAEQGSATFFSVDDVHTGLSTFDQDAVARYDRLGMPARETTVPTERLDAVCRAHAPADVHFLKIDVEGAERAVLQSADFAAFRPWIVLAEATAPMSTEETHAEWEPVLLAADYRFVWFDGLNRFYLAAERFDALCRHFRTPPNVFDGFVRAADTDWTRRITAAETRADTVAARLRDAELRAEMAVDRAGTAQLHLVRKGTEAARAAAAAAAQGAEAARLRMEAEDMRATVAALHHAVAERDAALAHAQATVRNSQALISRLTKEAQDAASWLSAMERSTSWKVTRPLRRLASLRADRPIPIVQPEPEPEPELVRVPEPMPGTEPPPDDVSAPFPDLLPVPAGTAPRAVHQFHSGTAVGDAITNAMLLTRHVLRGLGYHSLIFAEHVDPALADEIHPVTDLPDSAGYVLILRHSMGHGALDRLLALPARKVLVYHNITPPDLLDDPFLQEHARLGRRQLEQLRPAVDAALADSEYNALELRRLGFASVSACTLLFDLDALAAGRRARPPLPVFTVLFVGRVAESKGQYDLVEAFAQFRLRYAGDCRLVLVGRHQPDAYLQCLLGLVHRLGLGHGLVEIAGLVSNEELARRYAEADLYVSLSRHEGFGVPLIEAVARGVPVLAVGAGAVPFTLGDPMAAPAGAADGLLDDGSPAAAAAAMLALAEDPAARQALAARQSAAAGRFALPRQVPALVAALARAGAALPVCSRVRAVLAARAVFTVAGHVAGTYSLAEITRGLALTLHAERPGSVRLVAVEGDVTTDVSGIPAEQRDAVAPLLVRPEPATGPHVVVSHHYPVWVPPEPGDVPLSLFFWEESLVPTDTVAVLNGGFRGVAAPSRSVAKALVDSGVQVPVRVVRQAPRLDAFTALRRERRERPAGPFTFLHVSSCFPRKGVDVLLAAYASAFRAGDDVHLVIKGFPNPHNTVAADLARLRAQHPDLAPVTLIDEDLGRDALLDFYRQADAMVLPSRGEGYNLPAAEAMAAGIPLIVTGCGGHMDFLPAPGPPGATPDVRLLRFRFTPSGSHLATPFSLWAEPDEADLVDALRTAAAVGRRESRVDAPPVPAIADALGGFAADLLLAGPPTPLTVGWVTTWDVRCGIAEYSRHLIEAVDLPGCILADLRTPTSEGSMPGDPRVVPAWSIGEPGRVAPLMGLIVRNDLRALVIQHQPGLVPWAHLPGLLNHPTLQDRVVCITLHNTQDLLDEAAAVIATVLPALGRLSRVVVHTLPDLNTLATLGLVHNTVLIPQGADRSLGQTSVPRPLDPGDDFMIGSYGFFLPGKGIPQLIKALTILRRTWPGARLRLVNAEYPLLPSAEEIAECVATVRAAGLEEAVEFRTGFLPHAQSIELLRGCEVVALPYQSSKEGSSAALRSALSAGVPVAVTPLPLFDEAGDAVVRLPGTTPDEIAAGLDRLLRDRSARAAAVAAAETWLSHRSWKMVGERWRGMLGALSSSGVVVSCESAGEP